MLEDLFAIACALTLITGAMVVVGGTSWVVSLAAVVAALVGITVLCALAGACVDALA